MITTEDIEAAIHGAFDVWGISDPDMLEVYHSLRLNKLRVDKPVPTWDDFSVAWNLYKAK